MTTNALAPDAPLNAKTRRLTVCLTGGGTAGHVTPHFALLPLATERGWRVFYIGTAGLEKPLVEAQGVAFHAIVAGKLRRYISVRNLLDIFKVLWGFLQALAILARERPDVVFSKGGFVSVPVCYAARVLGVPVVSHESDVTPGLATKLIARVATRLVYAFAESARHLPASAVRVGTPIRPDLFLGERARGAALCGFSGEARPTLLVMGGSRGAQRINAALLEALPQLVENYQIVHLTGAGKGIGFVHPRYRAFEFVRDEMKDLLALADLVVSRAGANSIFELAALRKPMLLIPLEIGSRGDQIVNAEAFTNAGWALELRETELSSPRLVDEVAKLAREASRLRAAQDVLDGRDAAQRVMAVLEECARRR